MLNGSGCNVAGVREAAKLSLVGGSALDTVAGNENGVGALERAEVVTEGCPNDKFDTLLTEGSVQGAGDDRGWVKGVGAEVIELPNEKLAGFDDRGWVKGVGAEVIELPNEKPSGFDDDRGWVKGVGAEVLIELPNEKPPGFDDDRGWVKGVGAEVIELPNEKPPGFDDRGWVKGVGTEVKLRTEKPPGCWFVAFAPKLGWEVCAGVVSGTEAND